MWCLQHIFCAFLATSFIWYNATLKWHLKTREMQILFCLMLKNQGNFHTLLVVSGHVQVKVLLAATEFFKTSFFYWLHSFAYDTVIMHHKRLQASIKNVENIKLFLRGQQTAKSLHLCSTCYFFRLKLIVCNFVIMQPLFFSSATFQSTRKSSLRVWLQLSNFILIVLQRRKWARF